MGGSPAGAGAVHQPRRVVPHPRRRYPGAVTDLGVPAPAVAVDHAGGGGPRDHRAEARAPIVGPRPVALGAARAEAAAQLRAARPLREPDGGDAGTGAALHALAIVPLAAGRDPLVATRARASALAKTDPRPLARTDPAEIPVLLQPDIGRRPSPVRGARARTLARAST